MDRNQIFSEIDAGHIERFYLFYGPEQFVLRSAEQKLRDKLIAPGMEMMNLAVLEAPDVQQIIENCETLPFMSEKRLVIVRELQMLGKEKKDKEKSKAANKDKDEEHTDSDALRLQEYIERLPDTTCLIIECESFDKRKKFGKFLAGLPGCVEFTQLNDQELAKWLRARFKKAGAGIDADAIQRLVFLSGRDLTSLSREVEKLSNYVGTGTVDTAAVDAIAVRTTEAQVFDMINALFDGRSEQAFSLYDRLLRLGESRFLILSLIVRQIRQLYYAAAMRQDGKRENEIAAALGVTPYVVRIVLKNASVRSVETLADLLSQCVHMEYDIKRGVLREDAGFDRLMLTLVQKPEQSEQRKPN